MPSIMRNNIRYGSSIGGSNGDIVELTQEQYDALGDSVLTDNKTYYITDADDQYNASSVIFDNTDTNLNAGTVQEAIVEQNKKLNNNFNEMADVVDLEKQTQPYIVQKDGLLTATLNSSTTQWGYGNVSINGIIRGQVQNISNSATAMGITFEVYKGDVLTWESGSGGSVFLGIHYRK